MTVSQKNISFFSGFMVVAFLLTMVGVVVPASHATAGSNRSGILVLFDRAPGPEEHELIKNLGGQVKYSFHIIPGLAIADVPSTACAGLSRNPHVLACTADGEVYAIDAELDNTWGVTRIGAGTVHANGNKGTGVKVAVIDSGVDYTHPDLLGRVAEGYDFVNGDTDPMDDNGHGTHVAGTVAALDNDIGVVGVGPEVSIYALKVLNSSGSGYWSDIIAALDWAVTNGIQVTNNSYGGGQNPGGVVEAAFNSAEAAGLFHAAAAGNSGNPGGRGNNVGYPARYVSVVAVAATDQNDNRASFSSTGDSVELAAPGVSINSTKLGGGYIELNGTSMASPHVAGVAALVLANGSLTDQNGDGAINNVDLRLWLRKTADDLGVSGKDNWYGYGLVDADEAAPFAGPVDASPSISITNPVNGSVASGTITITANASDDNGIAQVNFYLDGVLLGSDALSPYEWLWDSTGVSDGSHVITATAVDTALQSKSDSVSITVDNVNDPPVANAGPDQTAYAGATVSFDGSKSTDDRGIVSYAWDFGDGATASGAVVNHAYTVTGIYTVTLTVVDGGGISASDTLIVTVNNPPAVATQAIVGSIGYSMDGGKNQNLHLRIAPLVVDDLGNPVGGASVSIILNHASGSSWSGTAVTDSSGKADFKLNNAPSGCYTTTVTDVSAANLTWNGTTPVNSFCK